MEQLSINLRRLRCFLAVAEERHFRRAAARLNMTQPPISLSVQKLEAELGVQLLERSTRSVTLTPAGRALQVKGAELMEQVARITSHVQRVGRGLEGKVSIGFVGAALTMGLPALITRFHEAVPDVSLDLEELPTHALVSRLVSGLTDLAFVRGEPPDPLDYKPFREEAYWLAIPAQDPLAAKKSVALKSLSEAPILFFPRAFQPDIYDEWIMAFHAAGVTPNFVQEIRSMGAEMGLVAAGVGCALVAESVTRQKREGVVYRRLTGAVPTVEVHVAWHPDRFSETAAQFVSLMD
jgi:DNA-binding transcriptional LysR family regulator